MKEIPNKFLVSLSLFSLFFAMPTQAAAEDLPTQAVPEVQILDVAADETVQLDGLRVRWTSVTYELSTGHEAEMFVEVDDHGRGDAYILLEGEELMHVATDEHGGTTTWVASDIDLSPKVLTELTAANLPDEIFAGMDPQEFKCSDFGKKAVRAAKYLWIGANTALGLACCATPACIPCGTAATVLGAIGADIADDYCE
jgi:hypothetical protein